mmetsp:Transcript_19918/g.48907  ORF Transcript_19918/g.48907 Transcript_19918/m.48907 type:complete len:243 (-) Transcript_19918:765-1493(-)
MTCRSGYRCGGGTKASKMCNADETRMLRTRAERRFQSKHLSPFPSDSWRRPHRSQDSGSMQAYATSRPSLFSRGYMLSRAVCVRSMCWNPSSGSRGARNPDGSRAKRIDFSCTWYANRKNANEELSNVHKSARELGLNMQQTPAGISAHTVHPKDSQTSCDGDSHCLNRRTGLAAHQKLATLSSYNPRAIGKILCRTCRAAPDEYSQGEKQIANVTMTTTPSFATAAMRCTQEEPSMHLPNR